MILRLQSAMVSSGKFFVTLILQYICNRIFQRPMAAVNYRHHPNPISNPRLALDLTTMGSINKKKPRMTGASDST